MSAPHRTTGRFSDRAEADRERAEAHLQDLLRIEGIAYRAVYKPGEVCRLLRISPTTLRQFCERAEPSGSDHHDPRALESFLVGSHHRIRHRALVDWLTRNRKTERD